MLDFKIPPLFYFVVWNSALTSLSSLHSIVSHLETRRVFIPQSHSSLFQLLCLIHLALRFSIHAYIHHPPFTIRLVIDAATAV
uniref:Secreted protein n=1 Tax=Echinococcus granulosus TaxID=6210 RepID=A0A068WT46_ECHGR|nr:hypothetical protein EgrG_002039000 [Echinococcus granulosus]